MPKKDMTPEERKAWGEKMKQARLEKANKKEDIIDTNDLDVLKQQIAELQQKLNLPQSPAPIASTKQVITKVTFDPKAYPDPRERLSAEEKLARIAFPLNYELSWKVEPITYEEDGLKVRAPRFVLDLLGKVFDEETNEPLRKQDPVSKEWVEQRYRLKRAMFFEDLDSFIAVANQMGVEVPESIQKDFADEMRYIVMRDWLFENFFPPKRLQNTSKTETVINNRLVEVFETSSDVEQPQPDIPFASLRG
jgi:hypothetical protein